MNDQQMKMSVFEKWKTIANCHRFYRQAMSTIFEIFIINDDRRYAQQAAWAAFDELERIEAELSRFIENSDISQINNLCEKQPLQIGLDTFECLKLSRRICRDTGGAFDVTVGALMDFWLDEQKQTRTPSLQEIDSARENVGCCNIILDEEDHTVTLEKSVQIDLGGIGKGYGVDRMAELLGQWSIDTALINGGSSSILAMFCPPDVKGWPVTLRNPNDQSVLSNIYLKNCVLSGSGVQKGFHIIDPLTAQPVKDRLACWVITPNSAASADALSTAFMVMPPDEIERYCSAYPDIEALTIVNDKGKNRIQVFGSSRFFGMGKNNEGLD